jgi:hypothetical protein
MSVIDLPPGLGVAGTPLGTFRSPRRSRRLAWSALIVVIVLGAITWWFVSKNPWRYHASTQFVLPIAFGAFAALGVAVRGARVAVTRDGVRWGWNALGFHQPRARIVCAHVYADGVALEATRGSKWFLAARDWDRFDALVRQLKRAELPQEAHAGNAPIRQRLQSYGRFMDGLLWFAMAGAIAVCAWAS